ncbi:MAG: helicase-associated domain-containing protein [Spirochaetia bacterium]|jgi:hypothetical protein
MKLFPTDWQGFLDELATWGELSILARRAFLDGIVPGISIEPGRGDPALAELRDVGYLAESERQGALAVAESLAPFHQVLKSLQKYPLFESPGLAVLCSYLAEHYSPQERSQLHESLALLPNDLPRIAGFVSSVEWLKAAFTRKARPPEAAEQETARQMLAFFTEQRDRIPVRDLEEYFPAAARESLCAGIRQGIQRAVFFLGLRRSDLEPLVGIWPAAARRLRRLSVVLAPEPVKVSQTFRHPFLIEDMTSILVAAQAAPIPLRRGDDRPYSRFVEEAAATLLTLPEWLEGFTGLSLEARIGLSLQALRLTGLLMPAEAVPGAPLVPGPRAGEWMRRPLAERQESAMAAISGAHGRQPRLFDLLEEEWTSAAGAQAQILPWLEQAFSFVPVTTFIRFADFAEYQAAIGSPLASSTLAGPDAHPDDAIDVAPGLATEEAMEELWKSFLGIFLGRCLLSLGGAEAGITNEGKPGFRMTDVGRMLLGLPRDGLPDPGGAEPGAAALVVQPNFEIIFLSPSPGAEAELGRFCERIGREVGVLFRITRQSLQKAGAAGLEAGQVLAALARGSRSPLPANVEHEIRGWMAARSSDEEET